MEVTYHQELDVDNDRFIYVYPLATVTRSDMNQRTTGRFALNLEIKSAIPLTGLVSTSHAADFVTARHSENYWQASLETKEGDLDRDIVLAGDLSRPKTGIDAKELAALVEELRVQRQGLDKLDDNGFSNEEKAEIASFMKTVVSNPDLDYFGPEYEALVRRVILANRRESDIMA